MMSSEQPPQLPIDSLTETAAGNEARAPILFGLEEQNLLFSHLPPPETKDTPRLAVPVQELLEDNTFMARVRASKTSSERERWFYILNTCNTVQEVIAACNQNLVNVAARYTIAQLLPFEELAAGAYDGLLKAIDRFDVSQNTRLSTFTSWYIFKGIQQKIVEHYRIPYYVVSSNLPIMFHFLEGYKQAFDEEPTPEELQQQLYANADGESGRPLVPLAAATHLITLYRALPSRAESLTSPIGTTQQAQPIDFIADTSATGRSPEEQFAAAEWEQTVDRALSELPELQRHIVMARFGIGEYAHLSTEEIAAERHMTTSEIEAQLITAMQVLKQNKALQSLAAEERLPGAIQIQPTANIPTSAEDLRTLIATTEDIEQRRRVIRSLTVQMVHLGFTREDISEVTGQSRAAIQEYLKRLKKSGLITSIPPTREQHDIEQRRLQVRQLRLEGLTNQAIAEQLEVPLTTITVDIRNLVKRHEIPPRYMEQSRMAKLRQEAIAQNPERAARLRAWLVEHPYTQRKPAVMGRLAVRAAQKRAAGDTPEQL